tara:strand:- start:875 stop:1540 length:666 start_codon:yes stop_codon:yes gene_type:complete
MSKKNAHLLQMTVVPIVLGFACMISSSFVSGVLTMTREPEPEPVVWSGSLTPTVHENITVEGDDGAVITVGDDGAVESIKSLTEEKVCEPTDTLCDPAHYSHIAAGNVAYMDTCGECHASGECLEGYKSKDDRCWKDFGDPYHDPDFTRDPDARCQANAQWIDLNYDYYDTMLNCDTGSRCADAGPRFCFRKGTRKSCESTAGGIFPGNDRVQDCVWITPK